MNHQKRSFTWSMEKSVCKGLFSDGIYICGMHYRMEIQHYIRHHRKQAVSFCHSKPFNFGRYSIGWHLSNEEGFRRRTSVLMEKLLSGLSMNIHGQDAAGTVFRLLTDRRRRIILQPEIIRQRRNLWQVLPNMFLMNICK